MANNTYIVDYAPTAKAGCKFSQCKIKIDKGALRIGKSFPSDRFTEGGSSHNYYHPKCWFEAQKKTKKGTKKIESEDDIQGFDTIAEDDQNEILNLIKNRNDPPLASPKKKKKDPNGPVKPKTGGAGTPKKKPQNNASSDEDNDKKQHNNKSNNKKSTPTKAAKESEDEAESDSMEKDTWEAVAANSSRVAKVLNSTSLNQVSVIILASASAAAIKRVAAQDDSAFEAEFSDPDAYLQWLASVGVLWISTDFEDAGFMNPGLWEDALSQILRQMLMSKPKKGIVVAAWGPETKKYRKQLTNMYQESMGTIQYRLLEGPTPLNATFNSSAELSNIDGARSFLSMHAIHWWPFEGEQTKAKGEKQAEKKKRTSVLGGVIWVLEMNEEGGAKVELTGGPTELGRALVNNKKISRKQCVVDTSEDGVLLTPIGVNPMTMSRSGSEDVELLSREKTYTLSEGDSFTLCGEQYRFVVTRPSETPAKSERSEKSNSENENEKSDSEQVLAKGKNSFITTFAGKKRGGAGSENESATIPFSAGGYDPSDDSKEKETKAKKAEERKKREEKQEKQEKERIEKERIEKEKKQRENAETEEKGDKADAKMSDDEAEKMDDEAVARKLQEDFDKEAKKKNSTPKSKHGTPDKDEMLARKLQDKLNKEGGGGGGSGGKKRKNNDDDDDGEVNWAAKVKPTKRAKKGGKGGGSDEDDDDYEDAISVSQDSDGDYEEEEDALEKKGGGGGGSGKKSKPHCKYGAKCYRANPEHRKEFSHPK